jgi:hypothetical protein
LGFWAFNPIRGRVNAIVRIKIPLFRIMVL